MYGEVKRCLSEQILPTARGLASPFKGIELSPKVTAMSLSSQLSRQCPGGISA